LDWIDNRLGFRERVSELFDNQDELGRRSQEGELASKRCAVYSASILYIRFFTFILQVHLRMGIDEYIIKPVDSEEAVGTSYGATSTTPAI